MRLPSRFRAENPTQTGVAFWRSFNRSSVQQFNVGTVKKTVPIVSLVHPARPRPGNVATAQCAREHPTSPRLLGPDWLTRWRRSGAKFPAVLSSEAQADFEKLIESMILLKNLSGEGPLPAR